MKKIAVLDLGTNVFNMLLASFCKDCGCTYLREYKCAARLGAGGLASGKISQEAFETASVAMERILQQIKEAGGADEIKPYATSAVRDALNGTDFVKYMHDKFGVEIEVIPGEREAELIFKGIIKSLPVGLYKKGENILMLDIGGGSNEFIISDGKDILWKKSFPIGMARMREKFRYTEPIDKGTVLEFEKFCTDVLQPLWVEIERYKPSVFVGSSGSFDTFRDLMFGIEEKVWLKKGYKDGNDFERYNPAVELPAGKLCELHKVLLGSTAKERLAMSGMSPIRVDYIVLASVFTQFVLKKVCPSVIYQSSYSLKEGAMLEEYEKWKAGCQ